MGKLSLRERERDEVRRSLAHAFSGEDLDLQVADAEFCIVLGRLQRRFERRRARIRERWVTRRSGPDTQVSDALPSRDAAAEPC